MRWKINYIKLANLIRGYGGPAFDPQSYVDAYHAGEYQTYRQLYEDVQLELDNSAAAIAAKWGCRPKDLLWFEDSLSPSVYASKSGLTVDSAWKEDQQSGISYLAEMIEWLEANEGPTQLTPDEIADGAENVQINPAQYDQSTMACLKKVLFDYEWPSIGNNWDAWGPYDWQPSPGEWERCRRIKHDEIEYPVTVLVDGSMIDGAHRLAVAIFNRQSHYPCLVGVPPSLLDVPEEEPDDF